MDPVSHVIFGRALTALDGKAAGGGAGLAAALGALAPDVDAALMPVGWDIYLRAHEVGTHSILGSLPGAALVGLVVHRVLTRLARRNAGGSRPRNWTALTTAAAIGSLSHLVLDTLSGAQVRPLWPIANVRVSAPLFAMADPFAIAVFIAAAVTLATGCRPRRITAQAVVAAMIAFFAIKGGFLLAATSGPDPGDAERAGPVLDRAVEARWGSLTEWHVFDRTADALRQWRVDAAGQPRLLLAWPLPAHESPLVRASRRLTTVRNFLAIHDLGFAREVIDDHGTQVLWSDIRFCRESRQESIECALWFGGRFNAAGQPTMEIVKVGGWLQTRAPAR